jgi:hypothetical protein
MQMTPFAVLKRAHQAPNGALQLRPDDAVAISPHADLLRDLRLITLDSSVEAGGELRLSLLGTSLMAQLRYAYPTSPNRTR